MYSNTTFKTRQTTPKDLVVADCSCEQVSKTVTLKFKLDEDECTPRYLSILMSPKEARLLAATLLNSAESAEDLVK